MTETQEQLTQRLAACEAAVAAALQEHGCRLVPRAVLQTASITLDMAPSLEAAGVALCVVLGADQMEDAEPSEAMSTGQIDQGTT